MERSPEVQNEINPGRSSSGTPQSRCRRLLAIARIHKNVLSLEQFSVILDIKSHAVTPEILKALIVELNHRGVHVAGVGSFNVAQIDGVSELEQQVDGKTLEGAREVLFVHFGGDLQKLVGDEETREQMRGRSVLLNGATFLETAKISEEDLDPSERQFAYTLRTQAIEQVDAVRRELDMSFGMYIQEGDCDPLAASKLFELSNSRPEMFELGFAWGGLSDEVAEVAKNRKAPLLFGHGKTGEGSQRALRFPLFGNHKDWDTKKNQQR